MKFRYFLVIFILIFLFSGCQSSLVYQNINQVNKTLGINKPGGESQSTSSAESEVENNIEERRLGVGKEKVEAEIPDFLDYPVPFAPQAPYGVWDNLHQEACEEAAMIIAAKYFQGQPLDAHLMEQGILDLVKWEQNNDYKVDLTAQEATEILNKYFSIQAELISEVTIDQIKKELAEGNLIIVPAAGRQLGNPYFRQPGPIYHMLVIRGYNQSEFITNDPGTKRGEGFRYKYQQLIAAIHNWNHQLAKDGMTDQEIQTGQKVMIVISK